MNDALEGRETWQKFRPSLLDRLEAQDGREGYATAQLRLVSNNEDAFRFYSRHGWRVSTRCPHESWDFEMINMVKDSDESVLI